MSYYRSRYNRYSRNNRYKRSYRGSKPKNGLYFNYGGKSYDVAHEALKTAKWVASVINPERKISDTQISATAVPSTGLSYCLTDVTTGNTQVTRNGNSVKACSLQFRMSVALDSSNTRLDNLIRVIIVIDTNQDENSSIPLITDCIQTSAFNAPLNRANLGRFKILVDRQVCVNGANAGSTVKNINIFKKLDHHVRWADYTDTASTKRQGHIYLFLTSNQGLNEPIVDIYSRFKFYDN